MMQGQRPEHGKLLRQLLGDVSSDSGGYICRLNFELL